jgi:hypothetical protein
MGDDPTPQPPSPEQGAVTLLSEAIVRGRRFAARPDMPVGMVKMWLGQVRVALRKIYGPESEAVKLWPLVDGTISREEARSLFDERLFRAIELDHALQVAASKSLSAPQGHRVFIGHGRSPVWRELKDFLVERLSLLWEEFDRESVPGFATTERLRDMLEGSTFAFLVMTAEDEHADATHHARANVIHEIGLFQGRLGTRRAIILLEEDCEQFSNIHGLSHISFPRGRVSAAFEEIRRVLEREQVIKT